MDWEEHDSIKKGTGTYSTATTKPWALAQQNTPLLQTLDCKFSMFLIYEYYPIHVLVDKA